MYVKHKFHVLRKSHPQSISFVHVNISESKNFQNWTHLWSKAFLIRDRQPIFRILWNIENSGVSKMCYKDTA